MYSPTLVTNQEITLQIVINQIDISDYQLSDNTEKILHAINAHRGVNGVLIFPELCMTGFPQSNKIECLWQKSAEFFKKILDKSRDCKSTLILGHLDKYNGRYFNTCYYIANGEIVFSYRKNHLWVDDIGVFEAGRETKTTSIQSIKCGSQICFDLEFPEGSRTLAKQGARIIFMPNGNMAPHNNVHFILTQARAIENQCFVISCNRVGTGRGGHFVGESLVVSPTGEILAKLGDCEETHRIDIDIHQVDKARQLYCYVEKI